MDLVKIATRLVAKYCLLTEAKRPIDRKVANATLTGFCEALNTVGFGMTYVEVYMAAKDAWDAQVLHFGPRPGHSAMSNDSQKNWDRQVTRRARVALESMRAL